MVYSEAFSVAEELAKANEADSFAQAESPLDVSAPSDEITEEAEDDSVDANAMDAPPELDPDLVDGVPVSSSGEPTEMDIPHIPSAQTTEHDLTDTLVQAPEVTLEESDEFAGIDPALAREPQVEGDEEDGGSAAPADHQAPADGREDSTEADDKDGGIVEEEREEAVEDIVHEGDVSSAEVEAALEPTQEEAEPPSVPTNVEAPKEESEAALEAEELQEEPTVEEKDVSEANEVKVEGAKEGEGELTETS